MIGTLDSGRLSVFSLSVWPMFSRSCCWGRHLWFFFTGVWIQVNLRENWRNEAGWLVMDLHMPSKLFWNTGMTRTLVNTTNGVTAGIHELIRGGRLMEVAGPVNTLWFWCFSSVCQVRHASVSKLSQDKENSLNMAFYPAEKLPVWRHNMMSLVVCFTCLFRNITPPVKRNRPETS